DLGEDALFSDTCAESRRRHDECARSVVRLDRLLGERGCRLAVVWNTLSDYTWFLSERLAQFAPDRREHRRLGALAGDRARRARLDLARGGPRAAARAAGVRGGARNDARSV